MRDADPHGGGGREDLQPLSRPLQALTGRYDPRLPQQPPNAPRSPWVSAGRGVVAGVPFTYVSNHCTHCSSRWRR